MTKRFKDAIRAQSATNPVGLTNSLLDWQRGMLDDQASTQDIQDDPACRLMVYHLSTLFNVENMSDDLYSILTSECESRQTPPEAAE